MIMSVWENFLRHPRDIDINLGALVFGSGHEVGSVGCHLDVCDLPTDFVRLNILDEFAVLKPANLLVTSLYNLPVLPKTTCRSIPFHHTVKLFRPRVQ